MRRKPLQQIWRDHLLAGSLLHDGDAGFDDGFFVFLYPNDNYRCAQAVESYRACMSDDRSFTAWTLEAVVAAVRTAGAAPWIDVFEDRYLAFDKIQAVLREG